MRIDRPETALTTLSTARPATRESSRTSFADVLQAESASTSSVSDDSLRSASEEFRDYMAKSDAEKMREAILKEMGLTEEEFKALPPEEQLIIEKKIIERLKEKSGVSDTGFNTNMTSTLLGQLG